MNLKEVFEGVKVFSVGGVVVEQIEAAEKELQVSFCPEYKELLVNYGAISVGTHEIAGLGAEGYLNVVTLTKQERAIAQGVLDSYIVIENLSTEGILILLDADGRVYEWINLEATQIHTNFKSYLAQEVIS